MPSHIVKQLLYHVPDARDSLPFFFTTASSNCKRSLASSPNRHKLCKPPIHIRRLARMFLPKSSLCLLFTTILLSISAFPTWSDHGSEIPMSAVPEFSQQHTLPPLERFCKIGYSDTECRIGCAGGHCLPVFGAPIGESYHCIRCDKSESK